MSVLTPFLAQHRVPFSLKNLTDMPTEFINNCTRTLKGNKSFSLASDSLNALVDQTEMSLGEILKLTFEVPVALFGVIGNILVVIVISRIRKKKQPADVYIQNLAIADLGILLLAFPVGAIREKAPVSWPFGEFSCLYLYPVVEIFYGASVWCIAVIAIERYRIMFTIKILGRNQNKTLLQRAKTVAACVWLISFLIFCLPLYFVMEYSDLQNRGKWCSPVWPPVFSVIYNGLVMTLFSYILPLVLISFTYIAISRVLSQSSVYLTGSNQVHVVVLEEEQRGTLIMAKSVRLRQNNRAKKILTPLVVIFAFTMLPLNIFRLTFVFWPAIIRQEYYKHLLYAVKVSTIMNSSANPVLYYVVSRGFRKGINNLAQLC